MVKLLDEEKKAVILAKTKEIRDEFFETYQPGFKDLLPIEKKKIMKKVPWHEHMTVSSESKVAFDPGLQNQEIQREVQIYQITMENVQRAIGYLTQEGIPVQKPTDYEVEMFKSPKQMNQIFGRQNRKEKEIKVKQEKILKKQSKKLSKIMKNKQMRDEHKNKKQNYQAIEEWKKEIREKGQDKARDLDEFIKKNQQLKKKQNIQGDGVKKKGAFKKKAFSPMNKKFKNSPFKKTGPQGRFNQNIARGGFAGRGRGEGRSESRGGSRDGPSRGGSSRGGFSRGGPSRGGPTRGGSSRGGPSRGGPSRGGSSSFRGRGSSRGGGSSRGASRGRGGSGGRGGSAGRGNSSDRKPRWTAEQKQGRKRR